MAVAGLSAVTANTTAAVVFAILATISASLMNVMNPAAKAAEHKTASSRFHAIENRIHAFVDIDLLTEASDDELVARFDRLLTEFNEADEKSPDVADRLFNRAYLTVRENPRFADLRADGLAGEGRRLGAERGWRLGRKRVGATPAPV